MGLVDLGMEASCDPQFASEIGNFTKDAKVVLWWLEKVMPKVDVPFRYQRTYFAASV
jgi:hypothetical protein